MGWVPYRIARTIILVTSIIMGIFGLILFIWTLIIELSKIYKSHYAITPIRVLILTLGNIISLAMILSFPIGVILSCFNKRKWM